ncbi:MAG: discoidin domain-containing protein [Armatimonadota bacterium]|nr:discoidin domain-containing protein [Armatimonadota bacterium]
MKLITRSRTYAGRVQPLMLAVIGMVLSAGGLAPSRAEKPVYPTGLTNIAASSNGGRISGASSTLEDDPAFSANNLIDGKVYNPVQGINSKGWASNKFDPINMDWVTIGFADNKIKRIGKIVFNPLAAVASERWAKDIEVQVSTESAEGPYTAVQVFTLRKVAERQAFPMIPAQARFVRFMFRANHGSDRAVALGEIEIYEAIEQTDPLGQLIGQLEGAINDLIEFRQTQFESNSSRTTVTTKTAARRNGSLSPATVQLIQLSGKDPAKLTGSSSNIAAAANGGRIVDSSSTFESKKEYGPQNLIDGKNYRSNDKNTTYGWSSEGFRPGREYVTIGFRDDRTRVINKIVVNPLSYQSNLRWARRIDVYVSTDSPKTGPFRKVTTLHLRAEGVNQDFAINPVEAKYVRFTFMANGPGDFTLPGADPDVNSDRSVSLGEIEIYEKPDDDGTLDALIGRFNQVLIDLKRLRDKGALTPKGEGEDEETAVQPAKAVKRRTRSSRLRRTSYTRRKRTKSGPTGRSSRF